MLRVGVFRHGRAAPADNLRSLPRPTFTGFPLGAHVVPFPEFRHSTGRVPHAPVLRVGVYPRGLKRGPGRSLRHTHSNPIDFSTLFTGVRVIHIGNLLTAVYLHDNVSYER